MASQPEGSTGLLQSRGLDGTGGFFFFLAFYAAIPVLGVAAVFLGPHVIEWTRRQPFDSAGWRLAADSPTGPEQRMSMVTSLLSQHELVGQSRAHLESLLGPDEESNLDAWSMTYRLSDWPGFLSSRGRRLTLFLDDEDVAYAIELRD